LEPFPQSGAVDQPGHAAIVLVATTGRVTVDFSVAQPQAINAMANQ
jgi:hypothetical protein